MGILPVNLLLLLQEWLPCASRIRAASWAQLNILTHSIMIKLKHCLKIFLKSSAYLLKPANFSCVSFQFSQFHPHLCFSNTSILFLNLRFWTVSSFGSLFSTIFAWLTPLSLKISTLKTVMNSFRIHWRWKKMAVHPSLDCFCIFVKNQFGTCIWSISGFCYFHWSVSLSLLKSHCLDYFSYVPRLKIR